MDRRDFLAAITSLIGLGSLGMITTERTMRDGDLMTVEGLTDSKDLGVVLPHEHILVDFIGADQVSRDRYNADEVFELVLPYLEQVKQLGCHTLVECTPAYLGRDPLLLLRLAQASRLKIITNTGYYGAAGDKYLPPQAFSETADQLAERWLQEWKFGIEGTDVRPGFIKIGVDPGALSEVDRKLVRAAAYVHLQSGLTIASHTGPGQTALEQLEFLGQEGVDGSAFIWVHAQVEKDKDLHVRAAERGAWVEFDGINLDSLEEHLDFVISMKDRGFLNKVLLSHDAGWFSVGEPKGGHFRSYETLFTHFLPALRGRGLKQSEIQQLTIENPRKAFALRVRARN